MKKHLAEKFGKNILEVNIVCLSDGIIYNDDKRIGEISRPLQVMVGNQDRKIPRHLITSLPDMILPDETEPRTKMSCGHAISKNEKNICDIYFTFIRHVWSNPHQLISYVYWLNLIGLRKME